MSTATLTCEPATASPAKLHSRQVSEIVERLAGAAGVPLNPGAATQMSDVVEGGMNYVHENYEYDIHVDDIATAAGLSKFHFIRKFQKEVGETPGAFLQHIRMVAAMKLLCATKDSVSRISRRVGYKDAAAFSRAFGRIVGTQPRRFRQRAKQALAAERP